MDRGGVRGLKKQKRETSAKWDYASLGGDKKEGLDWLKGNSKMERRKSLGMGGTRLKEVVGVEAKRRVVEYNTYKSNSGKVENLLPEHLPLQMQS